MGQRLAEVVDELRRSLALEYLREPSFTLSRIAWLLGYENSNLVHSCLQALDGAFAIRRPKGEAASRVSIGPAAVCFNTTWGLREWREKGPFC